MYEKFKFQSEIEKIQNITFKDASKSTSKYFLQESLDAEDDMTYSSPLPESMISEADENVVEENIIIKIPNTTTQSQWLHEMLKADGVQQLTDAKADTISTGIFKKNEMIEKIILKLAESFLRITPDLVPDVSPVTTLSQFVIWKILKQSWSVRFRSSLFSKIYQTGIPQTIKQKSWYLLWLNSKKYNTPLYKV